MVCVCEHRVPLLQAGKVGMTARWTSAGSVPKCLLQQPLQSQLSTPGSTISCMQQSWARFSEGKVMKMVGSPYSSKDIRGWASPKGVRDVEGGRRREALAPVQVWSSQSITE